MESISLPVNNSGLYVVENGWENCQSGHSYGPAIRDHYLLHYVASGKGRFTAHGTTYDIGAGQGFIIYPEQVTFYQADQQEPWQYAWIGYSGPEAGALTKLVGFQKESPVFECAPEAYALLLHATQSTAALRLGQLSALSTLYGLFSLIGEHQPAVDSRNDSQVLEKALWYMEGNYTRPLQVESIARFVGVSRSQLYRIFQKETGLSPKAHLQQRRVSQAAKLLKQTRLSLEEISASCGIASVARLSALFRQCYGLSAGQYRKSGNAE
ncbi:MAG: AraC family transcriptional regulator [Clostridia bacterium]